MKRPPWSHNDVQMVVSRRDKIRQSEDVGKYVIKDTVVLIDLLKPGVVLNIPRLLDFS